MKTLPRCIRDLLDANETSAIDNAPLIARRRHPTWYPVFAATRSQVEILTNQSVVLVTDAGGTDWLRRLSSRLTRLDDPEEAAAALAELRAYGGLLHAGFNVTPISRTTLATPDFTVDAGDGPIVVEVFTKHQDDDQKKLLSSIVAGNTPPGVQRSVVKGKHVTINTAIAVLQPGGAPNPAKPHDSVQANLISRVCAAKSDETQLPDNGPSLLWIDFRSFGLWPEVVKLQQATPLISGRDGLTSGALWYAFYGWRDAPILEEDFPLHERVVPMGHDGRFRMTGKKKRSKLSGVILVLNDGLTLLENPWTAHHLPTHARRLCERLPWFDLAKAVCNWHPGDALIQTDIGRRQIAALTP